MSEIAITRQDQGRIIEAHPGDVIIFRLEENLTTGYGWEAETAEGSILELIESTYIQSPGTAMGRGGMRVLRFLVKLAGLQEIHLKLRRPWDSPERALDQMDVMIQVR